MTETLAALERHLASIEQLDHALAALRGISAARIRQSRTSLTAIRAYAEVIGVAIADAIGLLPEPPHNVHETRGTALVVFCAEQGFAGAFSARVLDAAKQPLYSALFLVGTRGARLAEERGIVPAWHTKGATHADALTRLANRVAEALSAELRDGRLGRVELIVPVSSAAHGLHVERRPLLPLDTSRFVPRNSGDPPITNLPSDLLLASLAEEYVLALLCEAAAQAFTAEQDARLVTLAAARGNIERMLLDLRGRARQVRQQEVTAELIELASGAETVGTRRAQ